MSGPPIHCLLDCLAHLVRNRTDMDPRPIYLGVWNAPFIASEDGFSYYSEEIDPDIDLRRFEQLYGPCLTRWLEPQWEKEQKFAKLEEELSEAGESVSVIALVDLYYMPHSAICYGLKHLPHMLIVERGQDGSLRAVDPFFDWEGEITRSVLYEAFTCGGLSSGITIRLDKASEPSRFAAGEAFRMHFDLGASPLIQGVDDYLRHIEIGTPNYTAAKLYASIGQVGVIAKRWRGLGEVARYFADKGGEDGAPILEMLDQLLVKWENIVLVIVRLGVLGNHAKLTDARAKLAKLAELERDIRGALWTLFERWKEAGHERVI
ncbi:hypothetical protein FHS16_003679 [Paenibacillus endophyticus]|uniref:Butirosin biosynthesis protein H N-terminal domain-containing protein n=1 Tax=Paenibacillus endophyticus TaxID=1294268 RepID=A0A7W5CB93_9BACL|nr:DUF6005 family protein [Paenibacillus endophyticus]MBB3153604.1 hypothetical protein [Paenibacillus endophyticus]